MNYPKEFLLGIIVSNPISSPSPCHAHELTNCHETSKPSSIKDYFARSEIKIIQAKYQSEAKKYHTQGKPKENLCRHFCKPFKIAPNLLLKIVYDVHPCTLSPEMRGRNCFQAIVF